MAGGAAQRGGAAESGRRARETACTAAALPELAASISTVLPYLSFAALSHLARPSAAISSESPLAHARREAVIPLVPIILEI